MEFCYVLAERAGAASAKVDVVAFQIALVPK
jgi:hypothetical protein